ncbi:MAG: glycosyl hydrolase, partial [Acidobacteriota bacterium]
QVTEDGGGSWRKIDRVAGVPERSYVSRLEASPVDANTVFAAFDNHKAGDFKPYLYRSADRGKTWTSITGDLPQRGSTYAVVQDAADPKLLFAGTEYGLYFTQNGGGNWIQLKGNFPTIAVRDLWIQRRRNDLVVGTFGRGIYILDDYSLLRTMSSSVASSGPALFPPRDADLYVERQELGLPGKSFQGDSYFTAANPPFGAVFTYYLDHELKSLKNQRWELEAKTEKDGGNEPSKGVQLPTLEQLRAEARELDPAIVLIVSDEDGNVVRRITGPVKGGFHRVAWDLRYPPPSPIELKDPEPDPFSPPPGGPLAAPGSYKVQLARRIDGVETKIGQTQTFAVVPLYLSLMQGTDRAAILDFQKKASQLQRTVMGADKVTSSALERVQYIRRALDQVAGRDPGLAAKVNALDAALHDVDDEINGDPVLRSHSEPAPPSLIERVTIAVNGLITTSPPTETHRQALALAQEQSARVVSRLQQLLDVDLAEIEKQLNAAGAPWTPGRIPQ